MGTLGTLGTLLSVQANVCESKPSLGLQPPLWNHQHAAHQGIVGFDIPAAFVAASQTSRDDKRERM